MNRSLVLVGIFVVVLGFVITVISLSYKQNLNIPGMSKFSYGFPLSWYMTTQIVYPGTPVVTTIIWENLVFDTFFWSIIIAIPTVLMIHWREKSKT